MKRNWYTVRDLIARLQKLSPDANVLLLLNQWDAQAACDATGGVPDGQTVGLNAVIEHGPDHVYLVHSTDPDAQP